jgi:hypothetical protein
MGQNNHWLHQQLKSRYGKAVADTFDPLIEVKFQRLYKIYAPDSEEYIISDEVVGKVSEIGGDTIAYPSWSVGPTGEAMELANARGIAIVSTSELFSMLQKLSKK